MHLGSQSPVHSQVQARDHHQEAGPIDIDCLPAAGGGDRGTAGAGAGAGAGARELELRHSQYVEAELQAAIRESMTVSTLSAEQHIRPVGGFDSESVRDGDEAMLEAALALSLEHEHQS